MEMQAIESSFISELGYDESTKELVVVMGKPYTYKNVPKQTFERFMQAESAGKFFNQVIKFGYSL